MRAIQLGSAVVVLGIQALGVRVADADCASPGAVVAPRSGETLPPDPVIHVFIPAYGIEVKPNVTVESEGRDVPFTVSLVSKTDAFASFRIAIDTDDQASLVVRYGDTRYGESRSAARFAIDRAWRRPARGPSGVIEASYVFDEWVCSFTDAHFLSVTAAPAYRVEHAATRGAFARGEQTSVVFPRHTDDFWMWGDAEPTPGPGKVGLGHLNCMAGTAPYGADHRVRWVRVTPLWPDGSEGPTADPVRVDREGVHAPPDVRFAAPPPPVEPPRAIEAPRAVPARPQPIAHRPPPARAFDATPLFGLLASLLGFAVVRARLARATAVTRARVAALADRSIPQVLFVVCSLGAVAWALHAGATAHADVAVGFSIAAATWALVAGAAAALGARDDL